MLVNRGLSAISAPFRLAGRTVEIGISIGIVTAPDNARNEIELQSRADNALYQAKSGGRNQFCFYADRAPAGSMTEHDDQDLQHARTAPGAA